MNNLQQGHGLVGINGLKKAYAIINLILFIVVGFSLYNFQRLPQKLPYPSGFVLATHFSDQLTGSYSNLQSLQCLVGSLSPGIGVVEPFLHDGSVLGFDIGVDIDADISTAKKDPENTLRLSDLVDISYWQSYGQRHNFAPLVPWEKFEMEAPRQLILLDQYCGDKPGACMTCTNGFFRSDIFVSSAARFAERYNFSVVRRVCYKWSKPYSKSSFLRLAYGSYKPEESVLLINHFGGILKNAGPFRMKVNLAHCTKKVVMMNSNKDLLERVSDYTEKFLSEAGSTGYISVMIRMQYFAIRHKFSSDMNKTQQIEEVEYCLNTILEHVVDLKMEHNISSVFLATDMGKYGSLYFRKSKSHLFEKGILDRIMNNFNRELFEGSVTQQELTERIESVLPVQSSGYVAILERHLASNGRCLVLAGGGEFQQAAFHLHQNKKSGCVLMNIAGC